MPHARTTIREACATALTGLASTGSRVFQSRMRAQSALPCLLIETNRESIETDGMSGSQARTLELVITAVAKQGAGLDDVLDQIALEVEPLLLPATTLGGCVKGLELSKIDAGFEDGLDQPVGFLSLTYLAKYFTEAGAPGTTL